MHGRKYIIAADALIPAKDGIHDIRETFWIPDIRFAASGMTQSDVPLNTKLGL